MKYKYDDIEAAESALEGVQTQYLLERGWKQTCQNPASIWVWSKAPFSSCSLSIALRIARNQEDA